MLQLSCAFVQTRLDLLTQLAGGWSGGGGRRRPGSRRGGGRLSGVRGRWRAGRRTDDVGQHRNAVRVERVDQQWWLAAVVAQQFANRLQVVQQLGRFLWGLGSVHGGRAAGKGQK